MSIDLVVKETTPKVDAISASLNQSLPDFPSKQDLAQSLNQNDCALNDINMSEEVLDLKNSPKSESTKRLNETQHKEEVKRRRTRRSKKRRRIEWRHRRLGWSESNEQEVKRLHRKVVEHGQPLAPYNTTQFIMNDHNCDKEIDFEAIHGRLQRMRRTDDNDQSGGHNDEDFYSSPEDESDYLREQFCEAYDNIHAERLSSMSKNELVSEYLQLEDRVEDLEKRLKESTHTEGMTTRTNSEVQTEQCCDVDDNLSDAEDNELLAKKVFKFKEEIKKLSEENQRLRCDNERLERIVKERHITSSTSDQ